MAWKNILLFLLTTNGVRCECDSYSSCVGSFVSDFFGANYFKNIKSLNTEQGDNDFNNILANVSSFLRRELDNETIVNHDVFRIDNDTSVLVRAINIGEDVDFYNFDENQTLVSPDEFSVEEFLPRNTSSLLETISRNSTFQPLVFNFSEILVPVDFNATLFPQIKIEHYEPDRDQRENEISDVDFQEYYDFNEDNSTDYPIIDYIDLYKDTTNEISNSTERYDIDEAENEQNNEEAFEVKKYEDNTVDEKNNVPDAHAIFPWIAAIYIKNNTDDQFNYYCDGALLSNKTIVTAARCIRGTNQSVEANDILVLLGKNSLQTTSDYERVAKVEEVYIHDNFTGGTENDIAVLSMEDEVELCENIHPARLGDEMEYDEAYTTGWAFTGELSAIHFQKDSNCNHYLRDKNTFCAAYGNEVTVCPSYGGLFAVQANSTWYLQGIRTADPTERAICINRPVVFTALEHYYPWLSQFV